MSHQQNNLIRHSLRTRVMLLLALTLLAACGLRAQAPEVRATLQILFQLHIPTVSLQLETEQAQAPRQSFDFYYYTAQGGYQPLNIRSNILSKTIQYEGPRQFILYMRTAGVNGQPESFTPVISTTLPATTNGQFLLAALQTNATAQPVLYALPTDDKSIPEGNVLAFNLGNRPLRIATENQRLNIVPHNAALIAIPSQEKMSYQVMAAIDDSDSFRLVYRRQWRLPRQSRAICIFYPVNDEMTRWNSNMITLR